MTSTNLSSNAPDSASDSALGRVSDNVSTEISSTLPDHASLSEPPLSATADIACATLATCVQTLGMPYIERHIFICADQTVPKCCDKDISLQAWNYLKKRLKDLGLDRPLAASPEQTPTCIFRTKANCLRVCQQGPILVVYPDGVWYHSATPDVIEQIIQRHLLENQPVTDYIFLVHPLPDRGYS